MSFRSDESLNPTSETDFTIYANSLEFKEKLEKNLISFTLNLHPNFQRYET